MFIPKFWRKAEGQAELNGKTVRIFAWGYSDESEDEAMQRAVQRLDLVAERIRAGARSHDYIYSVNPMRESIVESFGGETPTAVITRNGYGSLVLNTPRVMFVDIDLPPLGCLALFAPSREKREQAALDRVRSVVDASPRLAFHVYRTCAGLRLLAADKLYEPESEETTDLMHRLGADSQYQKLCHVQRCFRARISPKPWRIQVARPPVRYPDESTQAAYDAWLDQYESAARGFATCRSLAEIGSRRIVGEIDMVREIHDRFCEVASGKELR